MNYMYIALILIFILNGCIEEKNPVISDVIRYCSISGFVFDEETDEPIPNAKINVIEQKEDITDSTGYFNIDSVACGQLKISVTKNFYEAETIQLSVINPDSITKNFFLSPARIISYRVYSTVTDIRGNTDLNIEIDDKISGFFSYQMDSEDDRPSDSIGYYYQFDKKCIAEFRINETLYKNSMEQDTLFMVQVINDYENPFFFLFYDALYFGPFRDFQLRDSLMLSELSLSIHLQDNSSKIFEDDNLLREIKFNAFDESKIFIHGKRTVNDSWLVLAEIDSLVFEPSGKSFTN